MLKLAYCLMPRDADAGAPPPPLQHNTQGSISAKEPMSADRSLNARLRNRKGCCTRNLASMGVTRSTSAQRIWNGVHSESELWGGGNNQQGCVCVGGGDMGTVRAKKTRLYSLWRNRCMGIRNFFVHFKILKDGAK